MSGNKHTFFSAIFLGDSNNISAYTFTGALYIWSRANENEKFNSTVVVHGHYNLVSDICWDPKNGNYLVSTSKDQTTRIYGYYKSNKTWHEFGRPQIHGYDINSVVLLNTDKDCMCKLVSCSEEKIIRVFEPVFNLVRYLNDLSGLSLNFSVDKPNSEFEKNQFQGNKQSLGLMTKQINMQELDDDERFDITNFDPTAMLTNQVTNSLSHHLGYSEPPDEDFLTNHSLWPETNKLYGHSYEVYTVASSHKGDLFASASSAKTEKYARLCIWSPQSHTIIQQLEGHTLTIAQIEFSKDDSLILTVSRGIYFNNCIRPVMVPL